MIEAINELSINHDDLLSLSAMVHARTRLSERYCDPLSVKVLLSPLVVERGFNSFKEYYEFLQRQDRSSTEWTRVITALIDRVTASHFFRYMSEIHLLVNEIMPRIVSVNGGLPVRIWSAACARGHEPLTIALALDQAGWYERAQIEIYGTDINSAAIEHAQQGIYDWNDIYYVLSVLSPEKVLRYFKYDVWTGRWRVTPELHRRVKWKVANLSFREDIEDLAGSDVIFCRNVLGYISDSARREMSRLFIKRMRGVGYLFVGEEPGPRLQETLSSFELHEMQEVKVFVKRSRKKRQVATSNSINS